MQQKIEWMAKDDAHKLAAWVFVKYGSTWWAASIDGVTEGCGGQSGPNLNLPPAVVEAGGVAAIGRVALNSERYEALKLMLKQLKDDFAKTPEGLLQRREILCNRIDAEIDAVDSARERAFERDIGGVPGHENPTLDSARSALAAFDSEHPEVANGIAARRSEAARRALNV